MPPEITIPAPVKIGAVGFLKSQALSAGNIAGAGDLEYGYLCFGGAGGSCSDGDWAGAEGAEDDCYDGGWGLLLCAADGGGGSALESA